MKPLFFTAAIIAALIFADRHMRDKDAAYIDTLAGGQWVAGYQAGRAETITEKERDALWAEGYTAAIEGMISTTKQLEDGK